MRQFLLLQNTVIAGVILTVLLMAYPYSWIRAENTIQRTRDIHKRPQEFLGFDLSRVRHYYFFMCNRVGTPVPRGYSLARFLGKLFTETGSRSRDGDAVRENRDASLAMVMLLGAPRLDSFNRIVIGKQTRKCASRYENVVLGGRRDLKKHFIYSAGIKLLSDTSFSYALGEIKEFFDIIKPKPTGFSFVDLAANLAGLRFIETAVDSEKGARWAQKILAGNSHEAVFFPEIRNLREGLTQDGFVRQYRDNGSERYRAALRSLTERIDKLLLHQWKRQ